MAISLVMCSGRLGNILILEHWAHCLGVAWRSRCSGLFRWADKNLKHCYDTTSHKAYGKKTKDSIKVLEFQLDSVVGIVGGLNVGPRRAFGDERHGLLNVGVNQSHLVCQEYEAVYFLG